MTFTTKYSLDNTLFFIYKNEITTLNPISINIQHETAGGNVKTTIKYTFNINDDNGGVGALFTLKENKVFGTKQELINSL